MAKRKIVCLCGSTRFGQEFEDAAARLTMQGIIVLTVGRLHTHSDSDDKVTPEQKKMLDQLHKDKIDMADEVLILNKGGYIGESTMSEIVYAMHERKQLTFLERTTIDVRLRIDDAYRATYG